MKYNLLFKSIQKNNIDLKRINNSIFKSQKNEKFIII